MSNIGLFLYSQKIAGVETFVVNLINSWPNRNDKFFIYINKDLKIIKNLKKKIKKNIKFIFYDDFLNYGKRNTLKSINNIFFQIKLFYTIFFPTTKFEKEILANKVEKILLVNGGYPGTIYHLMFAKKWKFLKNKKSWMVFHNYPNKLNIINLIKLKIIDYQFSKNLYGLISVSNSCLNSLKQRFFLNKLKFFKVFNGINYIRNYRLKKKTDRSNINILMLAVFEKRKGFDFIFKCMKKLKNDSINFKLNIYGDIKKAERKKLFKMIKLHKLNNHVTVNNYVQNLKKTFNKNDILVVPSRYESFGYTIIESMMFKRPVIATNYGGPKEIIQNNKDGFLINFGDVDNMCSKIKLLVNDKKKYNLIINNAFSKYIDKFQATKMSKNYYKILK